MTNKNHQVWRVFYTAARAEMKCERRLDEQSIEVFLPKYRTVRQWSDRKKWITEPLFRNYIFARVDEAERIQVLQTDGIVRCIAFAGRLASLSGEEVEQLKIAQRCPDKISHLETYRPKLGEHVEIKEGPLRGLKGEVVQHRGSTFIVLVVSAIRQAVRVEVPAHLVKREDSRKMDALS